MVGSTRSHKLVARIRELGWGRVFCGKPTPYPGEPWVLDNGAFAAWKNGRPFDAAAFAERAHKWAPLAPLFGVLPDVVGGGMASLKLSFEWLPRLPSVPWYLAVQDGMTPAEVGPCLDGVAGLFLGGTNEFKGTCFAWAKLAHERGLNFHYARVSRRESLWRARECGADSCDSTQPLWSQDHWRRFEKWVADSATQLRFAT
jgi:hypothetical protein